MELTEEHHNWIAESMPKEGSCSEERIHWISGAAQAIEKFGGIQWNKYPENTPLGVCLLKLKPSASDDYGYAVDFYRVHEQCFENHAPDDVEGFCNLPNQ